MKRSNRLVLLIGIFLALVAFILIVLMLGGGGPGPQQSAPPTTTNVVVATEDIALGTTIEQDQVGLKEVPLPAPADSYSDTSFVVGQVARQELSAGQLITYQTLNETGQIERLEVPPGKVAMSVKVNQTSGVGTVIKTGDYVDAVVAFNIKPTYTDPATGLPKAVEIEGGSSVKALLQGMQVLGTLLPAPTQNQNQPQPTGSPSANGNSTALNDQEQIVILAVSLQQAEVLNYSQINGAVGPNGITLVLRSTKDFQDALGNPSLPPDTVTTGVILRILIEQYGVLPPFEVVVPTATPR